MMALPSIERSRPQRLEEIAVPLHVGFIDDAVRAFGVAVRDAAGTVPVVEDELAVVLHGPGKRFERLEGLPIGDGGIPGAERFFGIFVRVRMLIVYVEEVLFKVVGRHQGRVDGIRPQTPTPSDAS